MSEPDPAASRSGAAPLDPLKRVDMRIDALMVKYERDDDHRMFDDLDELSDFVESLRAASSSGATPQYSAAQRDNELDVRDVEWRASSGASAHQETHETKEDLDSRVDGERLSEGTGSTAKFSPGDK